MDIENLMYEVRGAAFRVHAALGPGLLEGIYQSALLYEVRKSGLAAEREVPLAVVYDEVALGEGYRLDLLVERQFIIELKSVDVLLPVHHKQLLTYLKVANLRFGFLINFNCASLDSDNLVRKVNGY